MHHLGACRTGVMITARLPDLSSIIPNVISHPVAICYRRGSKGAHQTGLYRNPTGMIAVTALVYFYMRQVGKRLQ